ncbi:MAG: hypothetical protein IT495_21625 [Gammaproteobacteria bacterium]|nr:hypothetical protein [Gammaproteobacteria bacterium]
MRRVTAGNRLGGALALVVGVPWLFHAADFLLASIDRTGFAGGQLLLVLLVAGGLVVTLFGLSQLTYREETVIDAATVRWSRRGLSGSKTWREPLQRYRGVLKQSRSWSGHDRPGASATEYTLVLHHDEPSKCVRLYEAENISPSPPAQWTRLWTHYAGLFKLPLLAGEGADMTARPVEALARPLLELLAAGEVQAPGIDLDRPRLLPGLSLQRDGLRWVITLAPAARIRKLAWLLVTAVAMLGLGAVFDLLPRSGPALLIVLALAGVLLGGTVLGGAAIVRKLRCPDQIIFDAQSLCCRSWDRRRGWDTHGIPVADIVSITLGAEPADPDQRALVLVAGKHADLSVGAALTLRARRQLRDLLLSLMNSIKPGSESDFAAGRRTRARSDE